MLLIGEEDALGDFQLQPFRRQAGFRQNAFN